MSAQYSPFGRDFIFKDAVTFLKKKRTLTKEEYQALDESARAKAFTVSGYTEAEVLQQFLDTLTDAVEEGKSFTQFKEEINTFLTDKGYEAQNPWKLETIFRTNVQTAYNAGHYKSMTDPTTMKLRPYWQYVTAADGDVRDSHAAMHGRVYRADDPIWKIWYPPNGFRCRCRVVSRTKQWVERNQVEVQTRMPYDVDFGTGEIRDLKPDKGFSNNPAMEVWKPKQEKMSDEVWDAFKERRK